MTERGRNGGTRRGPARARGQRGAVPVRVLLALASSTCVTALVAGPMAFQASQADGRPAATTTTVATTTTTPSPGATSPTTGAPPTSTPRTSTTVNDPAGFALPAPTTAAPRATLRTPTTQRSTGGPTDGPTPGPVPGPVPTVPGPTVLGTTTTAPTVSTTRPPSSGEGIVWARSEARRDLVPLAGATVTGRVWVYFEDPAADRVRFWLDDPDATGPPVNVEEQFPFTLVAGPTNGQPAPFDTALLSNGPHSIRVEVTGANGADGAVVVRVAGFTVDN